MSKDDERSEEELALIRKRLQQAARWSEGGPVPVDPPAPPPDTDGASEAKKPKKRRKTKSKNTAGTTAAAGAEPSTAAAGAEPASVAASGTGPSAEATADAEPAFTAAAEPAQAKTERAKPVRRRRTAKGEKAMDMEAKPVKTEPVRPAEPSADAAPFEKPSEKPEQAPETAEQPAKPAEQPVKTTEAEEAAEKTEKAEEKPDDAAEEPVDAAEAEAPDEAAEAKETPDKAAEPPEKAEPSESAEPSENAEPSDSGKLSDSGEMPEDVVPAWSPQEGAFEELLEEERKETDRQEEEDRQAPRKAHGLLARLASRKLPPWLARFVDWLQKLELPEKVNLPRWLGPINNLNLPNQLTLLRILLIPVMMGFLYWGFPGAQYVALLVFIAASVTDTLDGRIARKYNLVTDFGKFADPLADKMLVTAAMLWFVQTGQMPAWALLIVVCREFAVSGLRMLASGKGRVIAAGWSGKVKTAGTMACLVLMFFPIPAVLNTICVWVITLTTLYSGVEYFLLNRDVIASI